MSHSLEKSAAGCTDESLCKNSPHVRAMTYRVARIGMLIVLLLAGLKGFQIWSAISANASFTPPPEAVTSALVELQSWQPRLTLIGSLEPSRGVTIGAEEPGKVAEIGFESGAAIKQGSLLVRLDTSVEEAKLQSAIAGAELAQINLRRAQNLFAKKVVSDQELNNASAEAKRSQAEVDELKALIARKTISAPFSGRAGIRMVNVGEYLQAGDNIVPFHQLDPLLLNFSVPQQEVPNLSVGQRLEFSVDVFPQERFEAAVSAIDPQVDTVTRNVRVQATISNPEERLRPGMFARVDLILSQAQQVMVIPGSAVSYAPYGNSVYVIEDQKDPQGNAYKGVRQQFVKLGASRGDLVAALEGLKVGEQVVTSGVFKLRPGAAVLVNNQITPGANPAPQPENT